MLKMIVLDDLKVQGVMCMMIFASALWISIFIMDSFQLSLQIRDLDNSIKKLFIILGVTYQEAFASLAFSIRGLSF